MSHSYRVDIIDGLGSLRAKWNDLIPGDHFYLSSRYLGILMAYPPEDYDIRLVTFYKDGLLVGGGMLQFVMFRTAEKLRYSFGPSWLKRILNATLVCFGNLTVTGDKPFFFRPEVLENDKAFFFQELIRRSFQFRSNQGGRPQLFLFKELGRESQDLEWMTRVFPTLKQHEVQPSMRLRRRENWRCFDDYLYDLKSNYRMAYRRISQKGKRLQFEDMSLEAIRDNEKELYKLYENIAGQAGFNSFKLNPNYFSGMKEVMMNDFKCVAARLDGELLGFYSMIIGTDNLDAHFIGMKRGIRDNIYLYNNMLYDMVAQLFEYDKHELHFSRTALESKSALGAEPQHLILLSQHVRPFLNTISAKVFHWLYPGEKWTKRHPFRQGHLSSPPRMD